MGSLVLLENISLSRFTSFKVGGAARFFCEPSSTEEIREALLFAQSHELPWFVLGKGSNVVISDQGWPGFVIHLGNEFSQIHLCDTEIKVQAGALLATVVSKSIEGGLAGIQKLGGIPGTVGGAIAINAGAYGQEIGTCVIEVEVMTATGELYTRMHADCDFKYRCTYFSGKSEIVLGARLCLERGNSEQLRAERRDTLIQRKEKQPLEYPNAGSMFKRPPGHFAGALIEQSGLKGFSVGGAQVSEKHAGFVINTGNATSKDIWELTERVIEKVFQDHGILLEREVIFLGPKP